MLVSLAFEPLSRRERGWGEGRFGDESPNLVNDRIGLLKHVVIPESRDTPAAREEKTSACRIFLRRMLRPIHFDDQLHSDTTKIGDIRRDRMLPTELGAIESTRS